MSSSAPTVNRGDWSRWLRHRCHGATQGVGAGRIFNAIVRGATNRCVAAAVCRVSKVPMCHLAQQESDNDSTLLNSVTFKSCTTAIIPAGSNFYLELEFNQDLLSRSAHRLIQAHQLKHMIEPCDMELSATP
jgi:hypothetical protein